MSPRTIDLFFEALDRELGLSAAVIITGAACGSLMGHIRPSFDIDFEIQFAKKNAQAKAKLELAIDRAAKLAGVTVNYSENIGGWSRVSYLDYRRTALLYKTIGRLRVKLISPEYWTIGKMARFLELDIQDMVNIIRKKKLRPERLIQIWARAIHASDLSLELGEFRDHVVYFLTRYGRKIWNREGDLALLVDQFKQALGPE